MSIDGVGVANFELNALFLSLNKQHHWSDIYEFGREHSWLAHYYCLLSKKLQLDIKTTWKTWNIMYLTTFCTRFQGWAKLFTSGTSVPLCNRDLKPGFMHTRLRTCSLSLSGGRWRQTSERGKTTQHIAFSPPLPHARVKKNVCSLDSPACKQRNSRLGPNILCNIPGKEAFIPAGKWRPGMSAKSPKSATFA